MIMPPVHSPTLQSLSTTHNGVTSTQRYSTATACFYYGYIVAVLPMALLFARLNLRYAAGTVVVIWGVVAMLTVVCHSYQGLYVQRFFLGLLESAVSPCFVAVTALWYKPQEQAVRLGIWYSATGIFSMFSGAINYGLGSSGNAHAWKFIYYFCGAVTIAWGFVILALLPVSPLQPGPFFTASEQDLLVRRFEENPYARDRRSFKMDQFVEAMLDIRTWLYLFMATMICEWHSCLMSTLTDRHGKWIRHRLRHNHHQEHRLHGSAVGRSHNSWRSFHGSHNLPVQLLRRPVFQHSHLPRPTVLRSCGHWCDRHVSTGRGPGAL